MSYTRDPLLAALEYFTRGQDDLRSNAARRAERVVLLAKNKERSTALLGMAEDARKVLLRRECPAESTAKLLETWAELVLTAPDRVRDAARARVRFYEARPDLAESPVARFYVEAAAMFHGE